MESRRSVQSQQTLDQKLDEPRCIHGGGNFKRGSPGLGAQAERAVTDASQPIRYPCGQAGRAPGKAHFAGSAGCQPAGGGVGLGLPS